MRKPEVLLQGDEPVVACRDVGQPYPFTDPVRAGSFCAPTVACPVAKSKILTAGIYRDISEKAYFADPCPEPSLSQSLCKIILDQSVAHAKVEHPRLRIDEPEAEDYSKAKAIGNAVHKQILQRGRDIEVISCTDFKTKDAQRARDHAFRSGRVPILAAHYQESLAMTIAARFQIDRHEDKDVFTAGSGEVMIAWEEDGYWYRALVDWLSNDLRTVDDYKSSGMSLAPHTLGIRAEAAGWHIQAAFIERGLDVLDPAGAGRRRFRFVGQEQYPPYALVVAHMDEHWLTLGRKKVAAADALWRAALKSGRWPAYAPFGIVPDYPQWAEKRWLERELSGEFERVPSLMGG